MAPTSFVYPLRVTYAECTVGNHVYYSRYLDYLEAARGEFFRHMGLPCLQWQEAGTLFPVVEVQLRYKGAARYDDLLKVELWVKEAQRVRLTFAYKIWNQENRLLLEGQTAHVCTGVDDKPRRLPENLVAALQPHLISPEPAGDGS